MSPILYKLHVVDTPAQGRTILGYTTHNGFACMYLLQATHTQVRNISHSKAKSYTLKVGWGLVTIMGVAIVFCPLPCPMRCTSLAALSQGGAGSYSNTDIQTEGNDRLLSHRTTTIQLSQFILGCGCLLGVVTEAFSAKLCSIQRIMKAGGCPLVAAQWSRAWTVQYNSCFFFTFLKSA